jgi:hypothetical protein
MRRIIATIGARSGARSVIQQSACRAGCRNLGSRGSRPKVVWRTHDQSGGIPYAINVCMRITTCSGLALSIALLATAPVSILAATPEHAPAIVEGGAFGLVTECEPDRAPSIVSLAVARNFILRNIPGWRFDSPQTPVFDVVTRLLTGPSLPVACEATRTGELEIPFDLGPSELSIDATASVIEPRSRHLAELTILSLHDRTVKLRFTMTGIPLPPFSAPCTPGQALVSVRVNILTWARPN